MELLDPIRGILINPDKLNSSNILFITGLPGAGKSNTGKYISNMSGRRLICTDWFYKHNIPPEDYDGYYVITNFFNRMKDKLKSDVKIVGSIQWKIDFFDYVVSDAMDNDECIIIEGSAIHSLFEHLKHYQYNGINIFDTSPVLIVNTDPDLCYERLCDSIVEKGLDHIPLVISTWNRNISMYDDFMDDINSYIEESELNTKQLEDTLRYFEENLK